LTTTMTQSVVKPAYTRLVTNDRKWHLGRNPVTKKFIAQFVHQMAGQLSCWSTFIRLGAGKPCVMKLTHKVERISPYTTQARVMA